MAHDGAALCERGFEDVAVAEIHELLGIAAEQSPGMVRFSVPRIEDLLALAYRAQSLRRVLLLLGTAATEDCVAALTAILAAAALPSFIPPQAAVAVACERLGTHAFTSADLARHAGATLRALLEKQQIPVTLTFHSPDVQLFLSVHDDSLAVGIDIAGFDLSRREYKVFSHPAALKGTIAYALLRLARYTKEKMLLTCFSKSGMVEVEAALFAAQRSPHFFRKDAFLCWKLPQFGLLDRQACYDALDSLATNAKPRIRGTHADMRHVAAGKKNAKIAAVHRLIDFSRLDIGWLDVTYGPGQVDIVIAYATKQEAKQLPELFTQAREILADSGALLVASAALLPMPAHDAGFRLQQQRTITRGSAQLGIQVFTRA